MELHVLDLYRALFRDLGVDKKTSRYVLTRLQNEGMYIVTTLLPSFSKHLLSCIEAGEYVPFGNEAFGFPIRHRAGLPVIFRGYLLELFTYDDARKTYVLNAEPCPIALYAIRQACEYLYKLATDFPQEVIADFTEKFVACDESVLGVGEYDDEFVDSMRKNFETFYPSASRIDPRSCASSARPGPGTFSGSGYDFWERKYQVPEVTPEAARHGYWPRLNKASPLPVVCTTDPDYSEVLFVPKDSRGPRVIVREPFTSLQFQMGYNIQMAWALESDTRHRINFADQSINQELARISSIDLSMCTLDLKDASDRVSYAIVRHLFRYCPILKYVDEFRTTCARLPDGSVIPLRKLSGMGSGFTFPTMSLIIHLAICTHISRSLALDFRAVSRNVYVYGDDIIVPTAWNRLSQDALLRVGLEVNVAKSYSRGPFRESCGGDFLHGNDVAPVRLKLTNAGPCPSGPNISLATHSSRSSQQRDFALLEIERHCRELVEKQLYHTANLLYEFLEMHLGPLPLVAEASPVLGRLSLNDAVHATLSVDDSGTHGIEKLWVPSPKNGRVKRACPYQYLYRKFSKVANLPHWMATLGLSTDSVDCFGRASVPRTIVLRRKRLSGYTRVNGA